MNHFFRRLSFVLFHDFPLLLYFELSSLPLKIRQSFLVDFLLYSFRSIISIQIFRLNRKSRFPLYRAFRFGARDPYALISSDNTYCTRSIGCQTSFESFLNSACYRTLVKLHYILPIRNYSYESMTFLVDHISDIVPISNLSPSAFIASLKDILSISAICIHHNQLLTDCDVINFSFDLNHYNALLLDYGCFFGRESGLSPERAVFYALMDCDFLPNSLLCPFLHNFGFSSLISCLASPCILSEKKLSNSLTKFLSNDDLPALLLPSTASSVLKPLKHLFSTSSNPSS